MVVILKWSQWHSTEELWREATVLWLMTEADHRKPQPTHVLTLSHLYMRPDIIMPLSRFVNCPGLARSLSIGSGKSIDVHRVLTSACPQEGYLACQLSCTAWWWLNTNMPMRGWNLNYLLSSISHRSQPKLHWTKWWINSRKVWGFFSFLI